jgi:hypothetical protein
MTDFSNNIANFFRSETKTFDEFKTLLKESTVQQDWLNAVALYRKGVFALQKNDFSGLDIIQQANDSLKKVLDTSKETVSTNLKALSESIESFKQSSPDDLQLIKFNFGMLYESCKEIGMKAILNEETFYEEENGNVEVESLDEEIEDADKDKKEESETQKITEETPTEDTIPSTESTPVVPNTSTETTPIEPQQSTPAPTMEQKTSGYKQGFEEGRMYVQGAISNEGCNKFGHSFKESLKQKIQTELHEKPYSWVKSYEEGFAAGCATEERVLKDLYPEEYKKFEEEKSK